MKFLTSYFNGFVLAYRVKKLVTTIFFITLILVLILAVPLGSTLEKKAGNSMAFVSLLKDFNFTVYRDFMNQFSGSIYPFISIAIWMGLFYILLTGVIIHLIFFIFILTVTDYAKIMMVENKKYKPFKTLFKSFGFVFQHLLSTYFLYLILLIAPVVLFIIYFGIEAQIVMSTGVRIFIIFLIQQVFIWCRIFIKMWILGSELVLYGKFTIKEKPVVKDVVFEI
ncbi:MAG: hypothetical protein P8Z35_00740 [Ignavibacteriaceae bacterium]